MFMKKKFINGLLMAAAFVVATGSLVSCKDLEEDRFQELNERLGTQITVITQGNLDVLMDSLKQHRLEINACRNNCKASFEAIYETLKKYATIAYVDSVDNVIKNRLTVVEGDIVDIKSELSTLKIWVGDTLAQYYVGSKIDQLLAGKADTASVYTRDQINNMLLNYYTIDQINNMFKNYYTIQEVKDTLANYYTKAEVDAKIKDWVTKEELADTLGYYFTKTDILEMLDTLASKQWVNNNFYNKSEIDEKIKDFITKEQALQAVEEALRDASTGIAQAVDSLMENKKYGTEEQLTVTELVDQFFDLREVALQAWANANEAVKWVRANAETFVKYGLEIERLSDLTEDLQNDIIDIKSDVFDLQQDVAELKAHAYRHCDSLSLAFDSIAALRADVNGLISQVEINTNKIAEIEQAYQDADKALKDSIDALKGRVDALEDKLNALDEYTKTTFKNLVTSIIIQAAENPVFGEAALPLGIRTNMLIARYGYVKDYAVTFPAASVAPYVTGATVDAADLTGAPTESFSKDQFLCTDAENNAGNIYVTVNPNTVDFKGQTLKMVNSQGVEAGIKLGALQTTDKVLGWGVNYTRANNGFYTATAKLDHAGLNTAMVRYDATSLKEAFTAVKSILTREAPENDGINAGKVALALYKNMSNFADRYGLEAEYEDGDGAKHTVTSDYGLAAIALRGLPYNFGTKFGIFDGHIPAIGKIKTLVNKAVEKVFDNIDDILASFPSSPVATPTIKKFDIDGYDVSQFNIAITIWWDIDEDNVVDPGETATSTVDMRDEVKDLFGDLAGNVNDLIDAIKNYLDDVNDVINSVIDVKNTIASKETDLKTALIDFLDNLDSQFGRFFNLNLYLEPVCFVKTADGFATLSEVKGAPSKVNSGDFAIVATTYTAEVLTPAYKKFARVTKAWNASDVEDAAAADAVNQTANMNKPLPGETNLIGFRGGKSGYTYEVLYEAMDYNGAVYAQKYYIKVQ